MPLCLMWNLWYERNKRVFDGVEHPTFVIKEHTLQSLYNWMRAQGSMPSMSFVDFSVSLRDLYCLKRDRTHPTMYLFFIFNKIIYL
jgi:hypothetical protein